ncbi:hypothetical protein EYF80_033014 [Liparis tanakae]|uniref:Uncharacterized protein n=1 Tax=Liparis tanakae TaxID=230148 RepID=A0A4Z2GTB6_9TELE|nr:hypothetical protein EYF80_033014 [Liparis tanakae]
MEVERLSDGRRVHTSVTFLCPGGERFKRASLSCQLLGLEMLLVGVIDRRYIITHTPATCSAKVDKGPRVSCEH